jgi:hypothetical protein
VPCNPFRKSAHPWPMGGQSLRASGSIAFSCANAVDESSTNAAANMRMASSSCFEHNGPQGNWFRRKWAFYGTSLPSPLLLHSTVGLSGMTISALNALNSVNSFAGLTPRPIILSDPSCSHFHSSNRPRDVLTDGSYHYTPPVTLERIIGRGLARLTR